MSNRVQTRLLTIFALLVILPLTILTPPFQVPDEQQHFLRAYQISEGHMLAIPGPNGMAGGILPTSLANFIRHELKTDDPVAARFVAPHPLHDTISWIHQPLAPADRNFISFTGAGLYPPLPYLPQAIGIVVARLFGAGPLMLLWAARITNALVSIALLSTAFALLPAFAPIGAFVVFLPMSLFLLGSASPDAAVIATSFLFTVLTLRRIADGGLSWPWGAAAIFCAITFCVIKIVYFPLLLLGLSFRRGSNAIYQTILLFSGFLLPLIWIFFAKTVAVPQINGVNFHAQFVFVLHHIFEFIGICMLTLKILIIFYTISMIGILGWLNIILPKFVYFLAFFGIVISVLYKHSDEKVIFKNLFIQSIILIFLSIILIEFALYINFTPVGNHVIIGIQGRYFLPLLPLFLICTNSVIPARLQLREKILKILLIVIVVFNTIIMYDKILIKYDLFS